MAGDAHPGLPGCFSSLTRRHSRVGGIVVTDGPSMSHVSVYILLFYEQTLGGRPYTKVAYVSVCVAVTNSK